MNTSKGFVALSAVLILSAVFLAVSIGIVSGAISEINSSIALLKKDQAKYSAEACTRHALLKLEQSLNYVGGDSILMNTGSCDVLTVTGSGNSNRNIHSESLTSSLNYKTETVLETMGPLERIVSSDRVVSF